MDAIKPRITLPGYKKALQEYGSHPSRIIEELAANSYDADATLVFIIHSDHDIVVVDNGTGISDDQFPRLLDLGSGSKLGSHDSSLKRSYLGSFGFGIKSTLNIAKTIAIFTSNKQNELSSEIDVAEFESHGFQDGWAGFGITNKPRDKSAPTGTIIRLTLKNNLSPDDREAIRQSLCNLPKADDFSMFFLPSKANTQDLRIVGTSCLKHMKAAAATFAKDRLTGQLQIGHPEVVPCELTGSDTIDVAVWCKGLDSNLKVPSLGQFAGVYVKVDSRILKKNFQGERVLDGISKYPKFKHGMRIEVPIDWVKEQISLGRDGLQFGNESSRRKFENELKSAVTAAVKPHAKALETGKAKRVSKATNLRMRKALDRIENKSHIVELTKTGYAYRPTDDYEMALILANQAALRKVNAHWVLMDFNGQLDFDCLIHDETTGNFVKVELEPRLESFLTQGRLDNTDCIITWTRGDWKVGKGKRGKHGFYELVENPNTAAHYRLLIKASDKSVKPKQILPVYCLDQALGLK